MGSGKIYYWDAAPIISWITGEKRAADEIAGLDAVADEFEKGKCTIVTSSIFRVEVLALSDEQSKKLNAFCLHRRFQEIEVSHIILDLANEIRKFYKSSNKKVVATPDAIHLATAIKYQVDVFHTFDGGGKKRGILELSGNVAGYNLTIQKPHAAQGILGLKDREEND
jgi:predicted nucleic acid-binding protein